MQAFEDGGGNDLCSVIAAVSHDILDIASRCFEPLAITGEEGNSMKLAGRAVVARYASVMTAAMATDSPPRNVYDPRVRELIRARQPGSLPRAECPSLYRSRMAPRRVQARSRD
jgi:hypothetical protein